MNLPAPIPDDADTAPAALRGALQRTLAASMDVALREWRALLTELEQRQAGSIPPGERDDLALLREHTRFALDAFARIGRGDPARLDHLAPADLSWHEITAEMVRDEAAGWALWGKVRQSARDDLAAGALSGEAVEGHHPRPIERAQFLAVREALADGLQPRNGMERLLVDGMAEAWVLHLRWLGQHATLDSVDAIRVARDARTRGGWEPPRLGEAEAVDRAAVMADRFLRSFLRLMRSFRDGRKLIGSMTVLGGQVNVAEQQIVANEGTPAGRR